MGIFFTTDTLRNAAVQSGFSHVQKHADSHRTKRYRARAYRDNSTRRGSSFSGPWRELAEQAAQDAADHYNGFGLEDRFSGGSLTPPEPRSSGRDGTGEINYAEAAMVAALWERLGRRGVMEKRVTSPAGTWIRLDLLLDDTLYEVKADITGRSLMHGAGQLRRYARVLDRQTGVDHRLVLVIPEPLPSDYEDDMRWDGIEILVVPIPVAA
jgi:hypothetical protein